MQKGKPILARKRTDAALAEARTVWLLRQRLGGASRREACELARQGVAGPWALAPGELPLSDSQMRRYLLKAEKMMLEREDRSRENTLWMIVARMQHVYALAVQAGDHRAALAALQAEALLLGLYPSQNRHRARPATVIAFLADAA